MEKYKAIIIAATLLAVGKGNGKNSSRNIVVDFPENGHFIYLFIFFNFYLLIITYFEKFFTSIQNHRPVICFGN